MEEHADELQKDYERLRFEADKLEQQARAAEKEAIRLETAAASGGGANELGAWGGSNDKRA